MAAQGAAIYKRPEKRVHRGFFYLNDEVVINSLSALESGKIDEVVNKVISAREGGFGLGVGASGLKVEGSRKSSSELEEELVRIRTRFSVFETWLTHLQESKALGEFSGWGPQVLEEVEPGDTVLIKGEIEIAPLQTLFQLFFWFAEQAQSQNTMFSQKGEQLKATKEAERNMRTIVSGMGSQHLFVMRPNGGDGPAVAMPILDEWLIGRIGQLGGQYSMLCQIEQVLEEGQELPVIRLTQSAAATPLEIETMRELVSNFTEAAKGLGVEIGEKDASVQGPALWVQPIAIYR